LNDLPGVISAPRFATYLQARGNDRAAALTLYEWNLTISAAFIVPLQVWRGRYPQRDCRGYRPEDEGSG
jgi:hypothetical protein